VVDIVRSEKAIDEKRSVKTQKFVARATEKRMKTANELLSQFNISDT